MEAVPVLVAAQQLVGDPTPEIREAADSYTDLSDIDPYLGTERDLLVRSISVIERPATNGVDPSPAIIAPPSFESGQQSKISVYSDRYRDNDTHERVNLAQRHPSLVSEKGSKQWYTQASEEDN